MDLFIDKNLFICGVCQFLYLLKLFDYHSRFYNSMVNLSIFNVELYIWVLKETKKNNSES